MRITAQNDSSYLIDFLAIKLLRNVDVRLPGKRYVFRPPALSPEDGLGGVEELPV